MAMPLAIQTALKAAVLCSLAHRKQGGRAAARLIALANVLDGIDDASAFLPSYHKRASGCGRRGSASQDEEGTRVVLRIANEGIRAIGIDPNEGDVVVETVPTMVPDAVRGKARGHRRRHPGCSFWRRRWPCSTRPLPYPPPRSAPACAMPPARCSQSGMMMSTARAIWLRRAGLLHDLPGRQLRRPQPRGHEVSVDCGCFRKKRSISRDASGPRGPV
jgi:hypothetical protein